MALSKKTRFKVFKRDNFICQYCGKGPPKTILEVDHVVCKKDGGKDDLFNLTTSCFACNRGKGGTSVSNRNIKNCLKKELATLKEEKEQILAYYDFLEKKQELEEDKTMIFQKAWMSESEGKNKLTKSGLFDIQKLAKKHDITDILQAIKITWIKPWDENNGAFRYMCGVLKNIQTEKDDPEKAKIIKWANSYKYKLISMFGYVDEKMYSRWIKDGIGEAEFVFAINKMEKSTWTNLKKQIEENFYTIDESSV